MLASLNPKMLTPTEWAAFLVDRIAYVKVVVDNGAKAYGIHGADGSPLALFGDRELAFAAVRQHELEPVSVH